MVTCFLLCVKVTNYSLKLDDNLFDFMTSVLSNFPMDEYNVMFCQFLSNTSKHFLTL